MTKNNTAAANVHPFEAAGLGSAPFRVAGMSERTFQACPGAPVKAGGCCKFCYTGIRWAIIVVSDDGQVFDVGTDCANKVDPSFAREARRMYREERDAPARAAAELSRAARAALLASEHAANEEAFRENDPEAASWIDTLLSVDGSDRTRDFHASFAAKCLGWARDGVDLATLDKGEHRVKLQALYLEHSSEGYVGTVGKRETHVCRFIAAFSYETSFGLQTIYKFVATREDGSHALLTWKTSAGARLTLGDIVTMTAKIEAHEQYRGQAQTKVSRPKFQTAC
jgi:hypothetical protein